MYAQITSTLIHKNAKIVVIGNGNGNGNIFLLSCKKKDIRIKSQVNELLIKAEFRLFLLNYFYLLDPDRYGPKIYTDTSF